MIKGIIFDMDGVLIEAKDWHYDALNKALKLFGFEINRFDHLTTYDGLPTIKKLEMLTIDKGLPAGLHTFINEMKQTYTMEIVHARCKPRFVHEYALAKLKALGYKLGLASNSTRATIDIMMQKANLRDHMSVMMSAEDVGRGKPDPQIYIESIKRLQLDPSECLVVEDNEKGVTAARGSGAHVMVVKEVEEVNLTALTEHIERINAGGCQ